MNELHRQFLASAEWREFLEAELLPWVCDQTELGGEVIEVGPGPGLTTDLLRQRADAVTAVELDAELAAVLAQRLTGTNVTVLHADATATGLDGDRFSAAACFSMLHHVPTPAAQDAVFAELCRLLRPGGTLVAVDSLDLEPIRLFHQDDTFTPLDPDRLADRLRAAGFVDPVVETTGVEVRFHATKPGA